MQHLYEELKSKKNRNIEMMVLVLNSRYVMGVPIDHISFEESIVYGKRCNTWHCFSFDVVSEAEYG